MPPGSSDTLTIVLPSLHCMTSGWSPPKRHSQHAFLCDVRFQSSTSPSGSPGLRCFSRKSDTSIGRPSSFRRLTATTNASSTARSASAGLTAAAEASLEKTMGGEAGRKYKTFKSYFFKKKIGGPSCWCGDNVGRGTSLGWAPGLLRLGVLRTALLSLPLCFLRLLCLLLLPAQPLRRIASFVL